MADGPTPPPLSDISAPDPQDTPPAEGGGGEDWRQSLVPEGFRDAGFVTKYETPDKFFEGMANLSKLAGQKAQGLVRPGENATPEEVKAFEDGLRELTGLPGTLDEYKAGVQLPKLEEGAMMDQFLEMGFKHGVSPKAMQGVIGDLGKALEADAAAMAAEQEKQLKEAMGILQKEWGEDFENKRIAAEQFLSEFSAESIQLLESSGWKNIPSIVRDLYALKERFLSEGDLAQVNRVKSDGVPTQEQLILMKEDPRYSDPDRRDENYTKQVDEYAMGLAKYRAENKA